MKILSALVLSAAAFAAFSALPGDARASYGMVYPGNMAHAQSPSAASCFSDSFAAKQNTCSTTQTLIMPLAYYSQPTAGWSQAVIWKPAGNTLSCGLFDMDLTNDSFYGAPFVTNTADNEFLITVNGEFPQGQNVPFLQCNLASGASLNTVLLGL